MVNPGWHKPFPLHARGNEGTAWGEHPPPSLSSHRRPGGTGQSRARLCHTPHWPQGNCCTCSCPQDCSDGIPALTRAGEEVQIQSSTLNWSHTCNSAALLYNNITFRRENLPSLLFSFLFADSLFQVFLSNLVPIPRKAKQNVDKHTLRDVWNQTTESQFPF